MKAGNGKIIGIVLTVKHDRKTTGVQTGCSTANLKN